MGQPKLYSLSGPTARQRDQSGTLFPLLEQSGTSEVHITSDPETGLRAIVAIHDTRRGAAIGGCRCQPYPDQWAALLDATHLARAMSYKAAIARLPCGGGKAVLMRPDHIEDRRAYFERFGRFVEQLNGRYITAVDSGTGVQEMAWIGNTTSHVMCTPSGSGDPSPYTALGVRRGIEAAVRVRLERDSLEGLQVLIQGVGQVGYHLARELQQLGARLTVTDTDPERVSRCADEFGARVVSPESLFDQTWDLFAPCALSGVITRENAARINVAIVAGAANSVLSGPVAGALLHRRGILYAPDYVINAGGLIQLLFHDKPELHSRLQAIHHQLLEIFERASWYGVPPERVADQIAEERLAAPATPG